MDRNVNKSVTRLLQHSILQLCNEHIGYTHKLQILGVLCMTVDDEQQELVIKVNNTLKRVNPASVPATKDVSPVAPSQPVPTNPATHIQNYGPAVGDTYTVQGQSYIDSMVAAEQATDNVTVPNGSASENATPEKGEISSQSNGSGRRSGRKGANPTKVHHVYDEGELISEGDDEDVMTVIPTDPDSPLPSSSMTIMPKSSTPLSYTPLTVPSYKPSSSPLSSASHKMFGSAKRKSPYQCRLPPYATRSSVLEDGLLSHTSTVRALLTGGTYRQYENGDLMQLNGGLDSQASPYMAQLGNDNIATMLVCMTPRDDDSEKNQSQDGVNGIGNPNIAEQAEEALDFSNKEGNDVEASVGSDSGVGAGDNPVNQNADTDDDVVTVDGEGEGVNNNTSRLSPYAQGVTNRGRVYVEMDDQSVIRVKEEPSGDDYDYYPNQSHLSANTSDYGHSLALSNSWNSLEQLDTSSLVNCTNSLPTQVAYHGGISLSLPTTSAHKNDGLTIKYTNKGPITVGANGREIVSSSRVKDIIMFDESSPLHLQKGNRIEADYMVDKLGMEGRKRRRRGPEDTLTMEEVAEYMGSVDQTNCMFKCKVCYKDLQDLTKYLQHTLTTHNAYICHQCGKSFTTKSSLLRHRPIHTGMRRFACSICKKTFYRKDKCKAHIKRHLGGNADCQNLDKYQQVESIE